MKAEKHKLGIIASQVECKTGWWTQCSNLHPLSTRSDTHWLTHAVSVQSVKRSGLTKECSLKWWLMKPVVFYYLVPMSGMRHTQSPRGGMRHWLSDSYRKIKIWKAFSQVKAFCGRARWIDTSITFTRYQFTLPTEKHFWTTQGHRKTCTVNDASEAAEEYIPI